MPQPPEQNRQRYSLLASNVMLAFKLAVHYQKALESILKTRDHKAARNIAKRALRFNP